MDINGVSAIVTGGGSGLGEATARLLAELGAQVTILDLGEDGAKRVAADIGGKAAIANVTSEQDVTAALDLAEENGPVRIVVNCAGIGGAARIVGRDGAMPLEKFKKTVEVNLFGTFNVMRLAAERMSQYEALEDGARGVIVNTASAAATDGQIGQAAYAASKGGIVSLALPAARELSRFGIRVNTLAPALFLTPLMEELPEEIRDNLAASVPYPPRLGDPKEFAGAVKFIVENQYVNAEVIRLDGGTRMPPK